MRYRESGGFSWGQLIEPRNPECASRVVLKATMARKTPYTYQSARFQDDVVEPLGEDDVDHRPSNPPHCPLRLALHRIADLPSVH